MILKQAEQFPWRVAAAEDWADKITHQPYPTKHDQGSEGKYTIPNPEDNPDFPNNPIGYLHYRKKYDREKPYFTIDFIGTHPDYQHQEVATALLNRMGSDYPDVPIDPGGLSESGEGLAKHLYENPEAAKHFVPGHAESGGWVADSGWTSEQKRMMAYRTAVQQMSPDITLQHIPHPNGGGGSIVRAFDGEQKVGELAHAKSGKIVWVDVHPDYRRQGIASAMLEHARAQQPGIYHAPNLERSDESRAWAKAVP